MILEQFIRRNKMKIYRILNAAKTEAEELKSLGAYQIKGDPLWYFSEYVPMKPFEKWNFDEFNDDRPISLTMLAKRLALNPKCVKEFMIRQHMLETQDGNTVLTERALKNGAKYLEIMNNGRTVSYPVYGEEWAKFLCRYRHLIEQIGGQDKTDTKPEQKTKYTKLPKLGIPDTAVFLDTETTGLSDEDEVIELGVIDMEGKTLYEGFFRSIRRNSPGAMAINHITDDMLAGAPDFSQEAERILEILGDRPIVGHNIAFDMRLLAQTAVMHGCDGDVWKKFRTYDTKEITGRFMKVKSMKLDNLCRMLGMQGQEKHRAVEDCVWTKWLCDALQERPFAEMV